MEATADEEATEFLEPVEEIVESVIEDQDVHEEVVHDGEMIQVRQEEVLEEIVEEDGLMYDTDGRVVEYRDVMVYEDGSEIIEEYVEVEDLGNGEYAYVMTDEHGHRRLLKPEEVEAVKKMPEMMEEVIVDEKALEEVPTTSSAYSNHKRGRFPPRNAPKSRTGMRGRPSHMMYVDRGDYYHGNNKGISELAKVDVEKYVPAVTVNRRPLPDNPIFKQKRHRSRKNPPWQEESSGTSDGPSINTGRSPSPALKEPMFSMSDDDTEVRFKCPECPDCSPGFPVMSKLCHHMLKHHDCQTSVREVQFFADRDFENFLAKVEKATLGKDSEEVLRKKSRAGATQLFVCNYMNKGRQKNAELVEVEINGLTERPLETCTAFVQKTHGYECIRVKYCDQHVHYDGNIGFRVPIAVKRRLFEMSFKRLPIPCMQVMLGLEAEQLLSHPSKFLEKLKNLSHVEIVELLGIINASLKKYREVEPKGKKIPIRFDTIRTKDGAETLVVKRIHVPTKKTEIESPIEPSTSAQALSFNVDGQEVPMMSREEEVLDEEENFDMIDGCDGVMEDSMLYDPQNNRDPLFEELTEIELGVLEAYERDIEAELTEEQKKERVRQKAKFSLHKVIETYQNLDTATHGLSAAELHTDTINHLREMASFVVELVCQIDAEVKAQFNPELKVEEIKRDMIAGIAMQERVYQPDRRPRRSGPPHQTPSPVKPYYRAQPSSRAHQEFNQRLAHASNEIENPTHHQRTDISDSFGIDHHQRIQLLREQTLRNGDESVKGLVVEEKPSAIMAPVPEEFKAIPWKPPRKRQPTDPNTPARKRGRPNKKSDVVAEMVEQPKIGESPPIAKTEGIVTAEQEDVFLLNAETGPSRVEPTVKTSASAKESAKNIAEQETTAKTEPIAKDELDESSTTTNPSTPAKKTRTGRVVKPKKWGDS